MHTSGVTSYARDRKPALLHLFSYMLILQLVFVVLLLSVPCFYVSGCFIHIGVICNLFVLRQ
jgi:hypothetical protein